MAEQKEVFLGLGRTFVMSALALIATTILIIFGKLPDPTMTQWVMLLGVANGTYTIKSVAEKLAAKNGGKP